MTRSSCAGRLVFVATLLGAACSHGEKEENRTEAPVPVATAAARSGALQGIVRTTGVVAAAPGALQAVTAPGTARIVEMPRSVGDVVRKGDLLIRFDAPALTADAAAKQAALVQAEARLENARTADERAAGLLERGIAARKDVEEAHRELRDAQAAVTQAQAERDAAQRLAERAVVHADFGGVVVDRAHQPGDLVDGSGDPLLRVVDPSRLQVEASLPPADLARVRAGHAARVRRTTGDAAAIECRVAGVAASLSAATGLGALRVSLPPEARLPLGLSVPVEVDAERRENATLVPSSAVVHEGPDAFVYVVGADHKASRRPVSVGISGEDDVEILSGVTPGEILVMSGQQALPDGAQVALSK
jgi:RND family efflux transporter MFP subunit